MKLLLHTCCGPCFLGVWEHLQPLGFEVANYFYNPNIFPAAEHDLRLESLRKVVAGETEELIEEIYDPESYSETVKGHETSFPGRCSYCYRLRLEKTAEYAKKHGFDAFSTTLLVSPYQRHEELKRVGEEIALEYGVNFYYQDWRPYFREGQEEARTREIYMQKYCGCVYSQNRK